MSSNLKELVEYSKKLNILFIEDNNEVREQLYKLFKNFFENIDKCFNGDEALEKYKKKEKNYYDLIISDISMPKLDGIQLCKEIIKINKKQEILIVSAHTEKEKLSQLEEIGIENILQKPVEHISLINTLSKIINNIKRNKEES
ncbi:hypothetical protein CP965_02910 [Halarcobacter mediterraneus]|uniref:Response regulatory domain-containing protein n=1 Tax=Halarcobacter mediterraneus TaxID=2023153 RepID=A0A4Q1AWH3_9BACT|nr:response regulator [Halarcobacter mediterraneus]RXK14415.1 hypothetical protein CP965_02910 [Halarcobacter mediterraneus]